MFEQAKKKWNPIGGAHPRLRWPILGLLMLVWCLDGVWAFVRALGRGVGKTARQAANRLRANLPEYHHVPRRVMAVALCVALCLGMLPASAIAEELQSTCPHNVGQHDEACGYVEAIPETPCNCGAAADEDGNLVHLDGCAYVPATEGVPCPHQQGSHDEACGYGDKPSETPSETPSEIPSETPSETPSEPPSENSSAVQALTLEETPATVTAEKYPDPKIYANGTPLLITGTSETTATIYIDTNGNGKVDEGELSLEKAGIADAPADGANLDGYRIYGGSKETALTADTQITMTGGKVQYIFGGSQDAPLTGDTQITIHDGMVTEIYGGGYNKDATVTGNTTVTMDDGTVNRGVYGGGYYAVIDGDTEVTVTGGAPRGVIGGGGWAGNKVTGSTQVSVTGGEVRDTVYGDGLDNETDVATVAKDTTVTIGGTATVGNVCSRYTKAEAGSSTKVTIGDNATVTKDIYGGGILTIGGSAKVGDMYKGVIINGLDESKRPVNGVNSFVIDPDLKEDAMIHVCLPFFETPEIIATEAVESDLDKITLMGGSAANYVAYFDNGEIKLKNAVPVTSVTLDKTELSLEVGETATLTETVEPANTTNKTVTWKSVNPSIATVTDGKITAQTVGSTYIFVTAGSKSDTCTVTVTAARPKVENTNIYANGVPLILAAGADGSGTTIYMDTNGDGTVSDGELSLNGATIPGAPADGADLSGYTIYGGRNSAFPTDNTNITMTGGAVANVYGGGGAGSVTNSATLTITGGTVKENIRGGGNSDSETGSATVTIGGDAKVGGTSGGIIINGSDVTNGVTSFAIAPALTDGATIRVQMPPDYTAGTIATGAVEADLAKITLVGDGAVGREAYFENGEIKVKTLVQVTDVTLDKTEMSIEIGSGGWLNATVTPADAHNKAVTWSSSDTSVATIQPNGSCLVSAQNVGTTIITATAGGKTATCTVTVTVPLPTRVGTNIFANGTPLVIVEGTQSTQSTIYIDKNGNGQVDSGELSLKGAGISNAPEDDAGLWNFTIYGGAESKDLPGNTKITMIGGNVKNIYGGGGKGWVYGNTEVTITGGTVDSEVGGGGSAIDTAGAGPVHGNTQVTITGGTVTGSVYGGSKACVIGKNGMMSSSTNVTITGGTVSNVYGSGTSCFVYGNTNVTIKDGTVTGSVYGSGGSSRVFGIAGVKIMGGTVTGNIYGGGATDSTTGSTKITVTGGKMSRIYGGSDKGEISGSTEVTVTGGTVSVGVYGGGTAGTVSNNRLIGTVKQNTAVTIGGTASVGDVYGGGGLVSGDTTVTIDGGKVTDSIYGGGYFGDVTGTATVTLNGGKVANSIYGGGYGNQSTSIPRTPMAEVSAAMVNINGGEVKAVHGGGRFDNVNRTATVTMTGGKVTDYLCGGGQMSFAKVSSTFVNIKDGEVKNVYGSGYYNGRVEKAQITITGGTVTGGVAGVGDRDGVSEGPSTLTLTVGGTAKVGDATQGIVIYEDNTLYGVSNFAIDPTLADDAVVNVFLPYEKYEGTIATGAEASDFAKIKLAGSNAKEKVTNLDGTDIKVLRTYPVTSVSVKPETLEFVAGQTPPQALTATIAPYNATNKTLSWSSSDETVATVDSSGTVTEVAPGEATITVTTEDGGKTATCKVTVTAPPTDPTMDGTKIYSNGVALVIEGTDDTHTTVYIDANRNGVKDEGEQSLQEVGTPGAPENGIDLSSYTIYGGTQKTIQMSDTKITMNSGKVGIIYGGGHTNNGSMIANAEITMTGGTVGAIYGGGGTVEGNTKVTMTGGTVGAIYGGGDVNSGLLTGNVEITMTGGTVDNVYGGSRRTMTGNTSVTIGGTAVITKNIYGGGGNLTGNTTVIMNGGMVSEAIYGGGENERVSGNTTVIMNDGTVSKNIYGGGSSSGGTVTGNTTVIMNDGTVGDIYGGGYRGNVLGNATLTMTGGTVNELYGGGERPDTSVGNTIVTMTGGVANRVYGGGEKGDVQGDAMLTVTGGMVKWDLLGGTTSGSISGSKVLTIGGSAQVGEGDEDGVYVTPYDSIGSVTSFAIDPVLTGEDGCIGVRLSTDYYKPGTIIATGAKPSDLAKIKLTSSGAAGKVAYFDSTDSTIKVCEETAIVPVTSVTLNQSALKLEGGQSATLTATLTPLNATQKMVTWSSSDTNVATVTDGMVTAVEAGEAIITAKAGDLSATCTVTVTKAMLPTVIDKKIYANGVALLIEGTDDSHTTIYIDTNRNGVKDEGEQSLYAAHVKNAPKDDDINLWEYSIYGGTQTGFYTGNTQITMNGGTVDRIFGGGEDAAVTGVTNVTMNGGLVDYLYGGGQEGSVYGSTSVTMTGGRVGWFVYGGGKNSAVAGKTEVVITGGKVNFNVFGGNESKQATDSNVTRSSVTIGGSATVGGSGLGVVINGGKGESAIKNGVKSVQIDPDLTGPNGCIQVLLPPGYTTGTIATDAGEADLARISVINAKIEGKEAYFDSKDSTIKVREATISVPVTGVTLNKNALALEVGKSETLTAEVAPNNATDKTVTWSSSDTSVATVTDGAVTAVKAGTATITATADGKSATCAVTVTAAVTSAQGGTVTLPLAQGNLDEVFGKGNTEIKGDSTIHINNNISAKDSITVPGDLIIALGAYTVTGPNGKPAITVTGSGSKLTVSGPGKVIGGAGITPNGDGAPAIQNDGTKESGVLVNGGAHINGGVGSGGGTVVYKAYGGGIGRSGELAIGTGFRTVGSGGSAGNGGAGITGSGNVTIAAGTVIGGAGGHAIGSGSGGSGGSGVDISGNVTVESGGSVSGGSGGMGSSGGSGGIGANSSGNGTITVAKGGSASGGEGGAGTTGSGGAGGDGTQTLKGNTIVNGSANGGQGGSSISGSGGSGGSGSSTASVTGSGTISGGNGGNVLEGGGQPGTGGSAIVGGSGGSGGPTITDGKKGVKATAQVNNTQNDSGASITVLKEEMVDAAVTDAERADNAISQIDVALNIVNKTAEKPNAEAVSGVLAGSGATEVGVYLDITLEKSVTKTTGDPIKTLVTDAVKPLTITMTIPVSMRGGSNFTVIRVHGSGATALPTRYDPVKHTLTISSDKFSTYAIAYTPEAPVTPPTPPTPPHNGGGGSGSTSSAPSPIITKPDGGTVTLNPTNPRPDQTVTVTPKPNEGYVVDQIAVTDKDGKDVSTKKNSDDTYFFIQPQGAVTVTVTFKLAEAQLPWKRFTDVGSNDWFYESVKYVNEKGLMNGTSDTAFSPYMTTSRAMIVSILWRLEGERDATGENSFADVPADAYYAKAVAWATENGIVKGYDNSNFGPNDSITREQLAAILYRYAQFKRQETPTEGMAIGNFSDNAQVSAYARDAMRWALGQGIISGKGNGILDPKGSATRAETSKMLTNLLK